MHCIVYSSARVSSSSSVELDLKNISKKAKANNQALGITGVLFYHEGRFLQLLEGPQEKLERLMTKLEKDPRHQQLTRIVDEKVEDRSFTEWNMDAFQMTLIQPLEPQLLLRFKELFLVQENFDGHVFIDLLKKFCATPALMSALIA